MILHIKINQTIPDLEFSTHEIDFGQIAVGLLKVVYFRLENKNVVPTEWSRKIPEKLSVKNDVFKLIPDHGSLEPHKKQNVMLVFLPGTQSVFSNDLEFKIKSNEDIKVIHCTGSSFIPKLEFETNVLDVNTILPYMNSE